MSKKVIEYTQDDLKNLPTDILAHELSKILKHYQEGTIDSVYLQLDTTLNNIQIAINDLK